MKYFYCLFLFFIQMQFLFSQEAGLKTITADELMKTDTYLSSKEMKGRLAGSEGYDKAAKFIAEEFKKLNLKPLDNKNYFQNFNVEYNEISLCSLSSFYEGKAKNYNLGNDFVCRTFTGSGYMQSPVVFCGYGISKPEAGYDDYAGMDVKGKVVMVFKQAPAWKLNDKDWDVLYARDKAHIASEHGAIGMILVSKPNDKEPQKPIGSAMEGDKPQLENFPMLHIDLSIVPDFLEGTGYNLKYLQSRIDSLKKPFSMLLKAHAAIDVKAKYYKKRNTENVIGIIEGNDPVLKNEYVMITAHLDHVGEQGGKLIFPGANDNASGSSCVLQIARAFEKEKNNLKRSAIFALFACEEHGTDGAQFFANNSVIKPEKIVAQLNIDCVGHGDSIQLGNGKSCPRLWDLARRQDSVFIRRSVKATWDNGGADLTPLFQKGVPGIYFVTTKSYTHLHLPSDKPETLMSPLFEMVCKLAYLTAYQIAKGNYNRETIVIQKK